MFLLRVSLPVFRFPCSCANVCSAFFCVCLCAFLPRFFLCVVPRVFCVFFCVFLLRVFRCVLLRIFSVRDFLRVFLRAFTASFFCALPCVFFLRVFLCVFSGRVLRFFRRILLRVFLPVLCVFSIRFPVFLRRATEFKNCGNLGSVQRVIGGAPAECHPCLPPYGGPGRVGDSPKSGFFGLGYRLSW